MIGPARMALTMAACIICRWVEGALIPASNLT